MLFTSGVVGLLSNLEIVHFQSRILEIEKTRDFRNTRFPPLKLQFWQENSLFFQFWRKNSTLFFLSYRTICSFWSPASKLAKSAREREEGVQDFVKMKSMIALVLLSPKPFHLFYSGAQQ